MINMLKTLFGTSTSPETKEVYVGDPNKIKICFVCTGNTCRSPMAAAAVNRLYGDEYEAVSAGLYATRTPIAPLAKQALDEFGIKPVEGALDFRNHISQPVTGTLLINNDVICGMTAEHTLRLITAYPLYAEKIFSMPRDIADPWGGAYEDYRKSLRDTIEDLPKLLSGLMTGGEDENSKN